MGPQGPTCDKKARFTSSPPLPLPVVMTLVCGVVFLPRQGQAPCEMLMMAFSFSLSLSLCLP